MDARVGQAAQAGALATELLAETAWRDMLQGMAGDGVRGQMRADWLAQTMASELAAHLGAAGAADAGGPHGA